MSNHERYRELSALAATGQLSSNEDLELNEHLRDCMDCRRVHGEYVRVVHHHLPKADATRWRVKSAISLPVLDTDVRDRFLARARVEGIDLSLQAERLPDRSSMPFRWLLRWKSALTLAALVLVALLGMWASQTYQLVSRSGLRNESSSDIKVQNDTLLGEVDTLRKLIQQHSGELEKLKQENAISQNSLQKLQRQLNEAQGQAEKLTTELQEAESEKAKLASAVQEKDLVIADLSGKNDKLHSGNAESLSSRVLLETQVRSLTESLQEQAANLERERELTAASSDVRKLMGARSLHILDVHDTDGAGKSAKAFGRVFYSEGQSLVFYAFDLPSGKLTPAKYTFQAWGENQSKAHSLRRLGTFAVDDHEQRRWVLKVNDPVLLRGIDSVFVTAEALGDTGEPRGKKLLYAYVVGEANHP